MVVGTESTVRNMSSVNVHVHKTPPDASVPTTHKDSQEEETNSVSSAFSTVNPQCAKQKETI